MFYTNENALELVRRLNDISAKRGDEWSAVAHLNDGITCVEWLGVDVWDSDADINTGEHIQTMDDLVSECLQTVRLHAYRLIEISKPITQTPIVEL